MKTYLSILSLILLPYSLAQGEILHVTLDGSGDFTEIQDAVDAAHDGDTILVQPGHYLVNSPIKFQNAEEEKGPRAITLKSTDGPEKTIVERIVDPGEEFVPSNGSVFEVKGLEDNHSILEGFHILGSKRFCGVFALYATIINCTLDGADKSGFCLYQNSKIHGSRVTGCLDNGIYANRYPEITESWVIGNVTGIYIDDNCQPTITNCVIAGNAQIGLYCGEDDFSDTTASNLTIANNGGPGILVEGGALLKLHNSIVWYNGKSAIDPVDPRHPDTISGSTISHCSFEELGAWTGENNILLPPQFVSEGSYDFTRFSLDKNLPDFIVREGDYRLRANSPALNVANPEFAPEIDIDGNLRDCDLGSDLGALERDNCNPQDFLRGDADANGRVELTDAIFILSHLFLGGDDPPCSDSADVDDDGELNLTDSIQALTYLFLGGNLPAPGPSTCGLDETIDPLDCSTYPNCDEI